MRGCIGRADQGLCSGSAMLRMNRLPLSPRLTRRSSSRYVMESSPAALAGAWTGISCSGRGARVGKRRYSGAGVCRYNPCWPRKRKFTRPLLGTAPHQMLKCPLNGSSQAASHTHIQDSELFELHCHFVVTERRQISADLCGTSVASPSSQGVGMRRPGHQSPPPLTWLKAIPGNQAKALCHNCHRALNIMMWAKYGVDYFWGWGLASMHAM